jgi:hypothetical protein
VQASVEAPREVTAYKNAFGCTFQSLVLKSEQTKKNKPGVFFSFFVF